MLEKLFPEEVVCVVAGPEDHRSTLLPEEDACVRGAVEKRVREFRAGRACARRALKCLGITDFSLVVGPDRAPVWPDGIIGSITHCSDLVAAAVAQRGAIRGLGLDAEPAVPLEEELVPLVCTQPEIAGLGDGWLDWAKAVFCAKEAIFKCLFPVTRVWLDFHDVRVKLQRGSGSFEVEMNRQHESVGDTTSLQGRFIRTQTHWVMGVILWRR